MHDTDAPYLRQAIALSQRARDAGNHPFGALLVDAEGQVVAEAENTVTTDSDVTAHAETNLVRIASRQWKPEELTGYTLYSSCEPCAMCAGAIFWSGIGRVVFALSVEGLLAFFDNRPNAPFHLKAARQLLTAADGVAVVGPAMEDEAAVPHTGFWESGS